MIAYLKGTIEEIEENKVIMEVNQIGYNVFVTARDLDLLSSNDDIVKLHTYMQVREDAMQLFGFLQKEDLRIFKMLLNVNGIGPKVALGILSVLSANDLKFAVLSNDAKAIAKAPGIGNKTAQKLILELKDKFDLLDTFEDALSTQAGTSGASTSKSPAADEAVQALVALGYPASDALKAVRKVNTSNELSTEELLKAALKQMVF